MLSDSSFHPPATKDDLLSAAAKVCHIRLKNEMINNYCVIETTVSKQNTDQCAAATSNFKFLIHLLLDLYFIRCSIKKAVQKSWLDRAQRAGKIWGQ